MTNVMECNEINYIWKKFLMINGFPKGATPVQITLTTTKPLSEEREREVIKWCDEMRRRYPHMKAQRIANKASKYFKL